MILSHAEAGAGPAVILLHGLFGAGKNLGVLARSLSTDYRVISLDLRNHGASAHDPATDYQAQAADVAETMGRLGISHAVLIGHSMGGKVAMRLALDRPDLVEALVVLDIAPRRYKHEYGPELDAMRGLALTPGMTRAEADAALAETIPDPGMRAFLLNNLNLSGTPQWRLGLDEIAGGMDAILDWDAPAAAWNKPALFVHGTRSDYVDEAGRAAIAAGFPRAEIVGIDASHWLHAERPEAVLAAIKPFLHKATGREQHA